MLTTHRLAPASGQSAKSAVILLHGLGDSGAGLMDLGHYWQRALPDTVFISPDAPQPCDMAPFGYQWFSLQNRDPKAIQQGAEQALPVLDQLIDSVLDETQLPASRLALAGFSQGTMMGLYAGLHRSEKLAGILGYSGALLDSGSIKSKPPVLLVHGMLDDIVPFAAMAAAEQSLKNASVPVTTLPCPNLGHSIDETGLLAGGRFLQQSLLF